MSTWQSEQLESMLSLSDEHRLFDRVAGIARDLGFEYCAYGARLPLPLSRQRVVMINNYPGAWRRRYAERRYLEIDPTVSHSLRSQLPISWTDDLFSAVPAFWDEARSVGLRHGWAQPSCGEHGTRGMLTVARSQEALTAAEMEVNAHRLAWLSHVAHAAFVRLFAGRLMPETAVRLSGQERAVMRWTAEGKTTAEISQIMSLSERTVNFHIGNAVRKLNTTNRTAAAVRAVVLGLLR